MTARTYDPKDDPRLCPCGCRCGRVIRGAKTVCTACAGGGHRAHSGVRGPVLVVYPRNGVEWLRVVM